MLMHVGASLGLGPFWRSLMFGRGLFHLWRRQSRLIAQLFSIGADMAIDLFWCLHIVTRDNESQSEHGVAESTRRIDRVIP